MKRIALGLFLGGMAVCAANAADLVRAVASKGYVDSVTGLLSGLNTRLDNTSLVAAINDLFDNITQRIDANSTDTQYPSASAVYNALRGKQDTLGTDQMAAVNSGITADKVRLYDGYATTKQNAFTDGDDVTATNGFISSVAQNGGTVTATATQFDREVTAEGTDNTAPTTKAVYNAIQGVTYTGGTDINIGTDNKVNATYESLDYDNLEDATLNADKLADGYSIVSVKQTNGKIELGAKQYIDRFDEYSATETQAPMTKTVYNALQGKQNAFDDGTDATTATGFISSVTQTNGRVDAVATAFDTAIDDTTSGHTNTAPTTNAVFTAMSNKVNLNQEVGNAFMITDGNGKVIPAPVRECSNRENKCVLTFGVIDDDGTLGYEWEVIARGL